jgi:hypothetical protein
MEPPKGHYRVHKGPPLIRPQILLSEIGRVLPLHTSTQWEEEWKLKERTNEKKEIKAEKKKVLFSYTSKIWRRADSEPSQN